jgi:hypothetical protein
VGLGATCFTAAGVITPCEAGLYCNSRNVCATAGLVDRNGPCDGDSACKVGLHCVDGDAGRFCDGPQPAGGWCNWDHMLPFDCEQGLVCAGSQCDPVVLVGDGQSCDNPGDVCLHGLCDAQTADGGLACPNVIPDGQPCPHDSSTTCDTLSQCINGVCQIAGNIACQPPLPQ